MKRTLCCLLTLFCLLSALSIPALADFGGYSGVGDSGGSSYSDYNDMNREEKGSGNIFLGIAGWAFLIVTGGIAFVGSRKAKKPTPLSKLRSLAEYRALDPVFDEEALGETLATRYIEMQNRWTMGDIEPLRPFLTPAFFTRMKGQLGELRSQGHTNYVDCIQVQRVALRGFAQRKGNDCLYAILTTRILDYTLDRDGNLVEGNRTSEIPMVYEWELCRPSGTLTGSSPDWVLKNIKSLPEEPKD